jgi:hypothetical protein
VKAKVCDWVDFCKGAPPGWDWGVHDRAVTLVFRKGCPVPPRARRRDSDPRKKSARPCPATTGWRSGSHPYL